jgi:hypothetical protein
MTPGRGDVLDLQGLLRFVLAHMGVEVVFVGEKAWQFDTLLRFMRLYRERWDGWSSSLASVSLFTVEMYGGKADWLLRLEMKSGGRSIVRRRV